MEKKIDFSSSISAKISAAEAVKKISNVPGWWGVAFSGSYSWQKSSVAYY